MASAKETGSPTSRPLYISGVQRPFERPFSSSAVRTHAADRTHQDTITMRLLSRLLTSALALCCVTAAAGLAKRASLQQVTNFGANSSGAKMYIYVPNKVASNPAIIVAIHYCSGTASAYYSGTPYATLAEKYGFIVIYPESPYSGTCWDVSSKAALTHNGGADSNSIVNMVSYTLSKYNGDKSRVFVTGTSSGAMMTVSFTGIQICHPQSWIFIGFFLSLSSCR